MAKVEKFEVVGSSAVQLTLEDGTLASIPPGHEPVKVQKDRRFSRAKDDGDIRKVYVESDDSVSDDEPVDGVSEPLEADDEPVEDFSVLAGFDEDGPESLDHPITELGLATRIEENLLDAGLETVGDVLEHGLDDLTDIDDIGEQSQESILEALESGGFV